MVTKTVRYIPEEKLKALNLRVVRTPLLNGEVTIFVSGKPERETEPDKASLN